MLKSLVRQLLGHGRRSPVARGRDEALAEGMKRLEAGHPDEAETAFRALLDADPDDHGTMHLLGHALQLQGRSAEAAAVLRKLIERAPASAEAHFSLGDVLRTQQKHAEAAQSFRSCVALRPDLAAAWLGLAGELTQLGRFDEAEDVYLQALQLAPGLAETHYNYGNLLYRTGRIGQAIASYRKAVEINPDFSRAHSNLVSVLNFSDLHAPEEVFREHAAWAQRHAAPLAHSIVPHDNPRTTDRRLRIGYVSPNFFDHAVTYFFEPALRSHDRDRFDVFCYSDVRQADASTDRLRGYGWHWRDTSRLDDAALARLVREDGIDILVDLTGHTDDYRLLMFARKPAPVQVTWNGYANTTGMAVMDYRISDHYADPPGLTEHLHSERLLRLPEIYMAFQPPRDSPSVGPPPLIERGHVTFGSFNSVSKLTARTLALWSRILLALPGARLMLLTVPAGNTRDRLRHAFAALGVEPERLEFRDRMPFPAFLAALGDADIALDPYPFHGTTTTCHSLWMGVPVVTLAGRSHVSRVGVSFLSNLGLERLVARDEDDYVGIATALAGDRVALAALRSGLRARMLAAPNTDGERHTRHLEAAYVKIWQDYCEQAPGSERGI